MKTATETQTGIVLGITLFMLSVMAVAIVWQAMVISQLRIVLQMMVKP